MDGNQLYSPQYLAENRSEVYLNAAIVLAVLETTFVTLFFTSRCISRTIKGWDVYLMLPSYICCVGHIVIAILLIQYGGMGRHVVALQPSTIVVYLKLVFAAGLVYCPSIAFPKLVVLCLYGRIFTTKTYGYTIRLTGVVVVLTCFAGFISSLTICRPISSNWSIVIPHPGCGDYPAFTKWISVPNLVTDVAILFLPVPGVWQLQMRPALKIGVTITLLTGCGGFVAGIIRFAYFLRSDWVNDTTYHSPDQAMWTLTEPGVYLIASTLPSLRSLMRLAFSSVKSSRLAERIPTYCKRSVIERTDVKVAKSPFTEDKRKGVPRGSGRTRLASSTIEVYTDANNPTVPYAAHHGPQSTDEESELGFW